MSRYFHERDYGWRHCFLVDTVSCVRLLPHSELRPFLNHRTSSPQWKLLTRQHAHSRLVGSEPRILSSINVTSFLTDIFLSPVACFPNDMANATTPRSSVMAAETCTPRSGKSAKGFGVCLPSTSKSGTSTAVSHHPVLSASLPEPSSKLPPESLPILLPIIYSPSGHPEARSSWPVTSDLHAVTKSSSGKPSQSSLVFSQFVATVRPYPTHSPVSALVNTATWPLIPNSHVPNCRNSYSARDGLPSNAYYEPLWSSPTTTSLRIASTSSENPGRLQSIYSTVTYEVTETPQSTFPTPASIAETTDGQSTVSVPPSIISTGQITPGDGPVASATHAISSPVEDASVSHS